MSPAAVSLLAVLGPLVWLILAVLFGIAIGRSVRQADVRESTASADHPAVAGDALPTRDDPRLDVRA